MKKTFKFYSVIWAVLLVLFNVISFVSVSLVGQEKYTASFWIGYVLITLTFIGQFICTCFALNDNNLKRVFYKISLITTSYTGLILSFVFGGLCMLISSLPYWIGVLLCTIVLALNITAVVKATVAINIVSRVDDKIKVQTFFVKSLIVDAEGLIARAQSEVVKTECKKVYEAVRYSDPMSNDALASVEREITAKFSEFVEKVKADNAENVVAIAEELVLLIGDRNEKCRLLK